MQEVACERGGYLHGRGGTSLSFRLILYSCFVAIILEFLVALDRELYLKEQMEAEEDAKRLLRRTEKRAFAAFQISFGSLCHQAEVVHLCLQMFFFLSFLTIYHKAATQADSSPASVPLPLRVEPKPKSGIRQQDLVKKVVEVKPKRPKVLTTSSPSLSPPVRSDTGPTDGKFQGDKQEALKKANRTEEQPGTNINDGEAMKNNGQGQNALKGLLGLAYESSDEAD